MKAVDLLREAEEKTAGATHGPWDFDDEGVWQIPDYAGRIVGPGRLEDAAFIAFARQAVPQLAALVKYWQAQAELNLYQNPLTRGPLFRRAKNEHALAIKGLTELGMEIP